MRAFHPFRQRVNLLPRIFSLPRHHDTKHRSGIVENAKTVALHFFRKVFKFHSKPDIWFVGTIFFHGRGVVHARKCGKRNLAYFLKKVFGKPFKRIEDVFLLHECHFAVYLGELRLAVGAQVFVAKAPHNLKIPVVTGNHQQLLESLRRLREGIKFSRIHAAWHNEIACTFGGGLDEVRRFNFQKFLFVQVCTRGDGEFVAQDEFFLHGIAAQVQVAVLHAQFVSSIRVIVDGERWRFACVEQFEFFNDYLDITGGEFCIFVASLVDDT